jgi:hypothetical protein
VVILPSTFIIGNTILLNGTCYTITGTAIKGTIPTFYWDNSTIYSGCSSCISINPCTLTPTPTKTQTPTPTPTVTVTRTPLSTKTPTPTPTTTTTSTTTSTPTPTNTTTPTNTPTPTSTLTPTPTVTSSPLSPIIGYFQDCCDANIKIKVGSISSGLTIGASYYLQTSGYSGCVVVISETNTNLQFNSSNLTIFDDCPDCLSKLSIVCPTPTPTPTTTTTPTQTPTTTTIASTQTPTPTKTPTMTPTPSSQSSCNNCGISGYSYIISNNIIT